MNSAPTSNQVSAGWRTYGEEVINSVTHGTGCVLAIAGAMALLATARHQADAWYTASCAIYGTSLVAVYAFSTLSHAVQQPRLKHVFRILDQAFIYVFIAGTFTPFALVYLRGGMWMLLFAVMWGIALTGFFSKVIWAHRVNAVAMPIYLLLGWLPILSGWSLIGIVPSVCLWWMLAGGLCYTIGTIFLVNDRRVRFFHAAWHMLVIAGSTCHFVGIYAYLVPPVA